MAVHISALKRKEISSAYLFLLPVLLLLLLFYIIPTIMAFFVSMTDYSMLESPVWLGVGNYIKIIHDPVFLKSIVNTVLYSLIYIPGNIVLAFILALMLLQPFVKMKGTWLTMLYLPRMTSMVVASFIWLWLYQPDYGLLNNLLSYVGIPPQKWIYSSSAVLPSVALVTIWKEVGYTTVLVIAGLEGIPKDFYDASEVDGATKWQTFWKITIPLLKPVLLLVIIRTTIESFRVFTQIFVMTKGGPANASTTIIHQIYQTGFEYMRLGEASAMSFILLFILVIVFIPYFRMLREKTTF